MKLGRKIHSPKLRETESLSDNVLGGHQLGLPCHLFPPEQPCPECRPTQTLRYTETEFPFAESFYPHPPNRPSVLVHVLAFGVCERARECLRVYAKEIGENKEKIFREPFMHVVA